MDKKAHWEQVYQTKSAEQVSWTQAVPQTSLNLIQSLNLPKTAKIIDIGGGDSNLVDYLLQEGFKNITVLDISSAAIERAKARLGDESKFVNWVVSDITEFKTDDRFDLWHDRATFHFLMSTKQIAAYLKIAETVVNSYMVVGTFSENGPEKCSGLPIMQYTEDQLTQQLNKSFKKCKCVSEDHITPFNTKQNFLFCSFEKKEYVTF